MELLHSPLQLESVSAIEDYLLLSGSNLTGDVWDGHISVYHRLPGLLTPLASIPMQHGVVAAKWWGLQAICVCDNGDLVSFATHTLDQSKTVPAHHSMCTSLAVAQEHIMSASQDECELSSVALWNSNFVEVLRVAPKAGQITHVEVVHEDVFLTSHKDGKVLLLDARSGDFLLLSQLEDAVVCATHSSSITYVASEGGQLGCYDIRMPESQMQFTVSFIQAIDSLAECVKANPEGSLLAIGFEDGGIQVFRLPEFELTFKGKPHSDVVKGFEWGLEKQLYSVSYDGSLKQHSVDSLIGNDSVEKEHR